MKRRKLLTALFLLLAVCALALGIAAVRRAQRLPSSAGVRVPVLMYHAVGDDCWGEEHLFVRPAELEQQLADTEILRAEAERLRTEEETLRRENETLRGPAAQYQSLKDHIADIEISAHRRTEQFREEAVTRLRQLAARQREWCRTAQADYEQMNCQLLERLQQAEQTLRQPDMSSFRRMEEGLTALEKGLTAPEKAGE